MYEANSAVHGKNVEELITIHIYTEAPTADTDTCTHFGPSRGLGKGLAKNS